MKFSKLLFPFSVIAIVVVIGAVFLLNQNSEPQEGTVLYPPQPTPNPTPSPTPVPQAAVEVPKDWLTYRNEEFGFEVQYPGNFSHDEFKPNRRVTFFDGEGETSILMTIFEKNGSFTHYLSEIDSIRYRSGSPEPKFKKVFELQGMLARTQEFAETTLYTIETLVEISPTLILLVSTERGNNLLPIDEPTRSFYNQILSTLRFSDSQK